MQEDTAKVSITPNMALYATENLVCPEDAEGRALFRNLILKLYGVAIPLEAVFTKEELWALQKIAKSAGSVGTERVGLAWLTIIKTELLRLEAQAVIHAAVTRVGETEEPGTDPQAAREKLAGWGK